MQKHKVYVDTYAAVGGCHYHVIGWIELNEVLHDQNLNSYAHAAIVRLKGTTSQAGCAPTITIGYERVQPTDPDNINAGLTIRAKINFWDEKKLIDTQDINSSPELIQILYAHYMELRAAALAAGIIN